MTKAPKVHALHPLGHEAVQAILPGMREDVLRFAEAARASPAFGDAAATVPGPRLMDLPGLKSYLAEYAVALMRAGDDVQRAKQSCDIYAHHLHYAINFELHRRKVFWVDDALAWMLLHTNLDIEGRSLKLPFPSFALVFQDDATLEVVDALLAQDAMWVLRGERVRILTVYVARSPNTGDDVEIDINFVADGRSGILPFLFGRALYARPDDKLATILDSHPAWANTHGLSGLPELTSLVHLVINAVLYSTSASDAWPLLPSPASSVQAKVRGLGAKRQKRAATRAAELKKTHSRESVYFLPGKIPISRLRQLRQAERADAGGELFARFMVRGHWRTPAAHWSDQNVRWIEPYWKGPDIATVVEREYRMKL